MRPLGFVDPAALPGKEVYLALAQLDKTRSTKQGFEK
jgi:hypothetical protein